MKLLIKILSVILIIFMVAFCAGYILTAMFAKSLIKDQIQKQLGINIEIASTTLGFPLNLNINGLVMGDLLRIEKIKISPSIIGLISGRIVLNNITLIRPEVTIERKKDGTFNIPQIPKQEKSQIIAAGLTVRNGTIEVSDKKVSKDTFSFAIKNISVKIYKAQPMPYPLTIKYKLGASIPSRPNIKEGSINANGWIDISNKDMQGDFNISDIDVMFFRPYFGRFISADKEIDSARANLNADLSAKNNDLLIACQLSIKNLPFKKEAKPLPTETQEAQTEESSLGALALPSLELLKNPQGEIVLDFEIRTKLDSPRLNKIRLKGRVFQNVLEKAIQESQAVVDTIKDIGEQFKDKGKELEDVFKSIFRDKKE